MKKPTFTPGQIINLPTLGLLVFVEELTQGLRLKKPNGKDTIVPFASWELLQAETEDDFLHPQQFAARRLGELYDFASGLLGSALVELPHRPVTENEAEQTQAATGLDIRGYTHMVDTYGIRHGIRRHASVKEEKQGQIPLTRGDYQQIPNVIANPDSVKYVGKTDKNLDGIEYSKQIDGGCFIIVEEMRTKRKNLALTSIRKRKVRAVDSPPPASPTFAEAVASTSETVASMAATDIIPETQLKPEEI